MNEILPRPIQRIQNSRFYNTPATEGALARLEGVVVKLKLKAQLKGLTPAAQTACCVLIRLVAMGQDNSLWFSEALVQLEHLGFAPDEIKAGWTEAGKLLERAIPGPPQRLQPLP